MIKHLPTDSILNKEVDYLSDYMTRKNYSVKTIKSYIHCNQVINAIKLYAKQRLKQYLINSQTRNTDVN